MNILILSFEFPPSPGGIGNYGYNLSRQLHKTGHKIISVATYRNINEDEINSFITQQPFKVVHFKKYNYRLTSILFNLHFFKDIIKKQEIQLIINVYHKAGIIGWFFKKFYNIPYFSIAHGSEFLPINFFHDKMINLIFKNSDCVIPNSIYTNQLMEKAQIVNNNIKLVHPGADSDTFKINERPEKKLRDKTILISIGALSVRKGHKYIIDAIKLLEDNFNIEYWIIGKGAELNNLKRYIDSKNLQNKVKILGYIPTSELPVHLKNADIFVLHSINDDPTEIEGFGIVLIEANLMMLPVIATKNSGSEDAVEDGLSGILVEQKDSVDLAKAIEKLIVDENYYLQMSQYGYKRAVNNFTWEKSASKFNALIQDFFNSH